MSYHLERSESSQNGLANSERTLDTPLTEPNDFGGEDYFNNAARGLDESPAIGGYGVPQGDGTIDPRLLDKRLGHTSQSVSSVGQWMDLDLPGEAQNTVTIDNPAAPAPELALRSVQSRAAFRVDDSPWSSARQAQHSPGFGSQSSRRSLAEGPAAIEIDAASLRILASSNVTIVEHRPKKVPIARWPSTSDKSESSTSSFACDECEKITTRESDLTRHKIEIHGAADTFFRCDDPDCRWDDCRLDKVQAHCRQKHDQKSGSERYSIEHGQPSRVKRPRGPNKSPRKRKG